MGDSPTAKEKGNGESLGKSNSDNDGENSTRLAVDRAMLNMKRKNGHEATQQKQEVVRTNQY